jgi:hypothetical protein
MMRYGDSASHIPVSLVVNILDKGIPVSGFCSAVHPAYRAGHINPSLNFDFFEFQQYSI